MAKIKLFRPETYPCEIIELRKELNNLPHNLIIELKTASHLMDYIEDKMWKDNTTFATLHKKLVSALKPYEIILYHNTRLANLDSVKNMGLIFSDRRYLRFLHESMQNASIELAVADEILVLVKQEIKRFDYDGKNRRKNGICFFYDIDYYKAYNKFLDAFGGEFVEYALAENTLPMKYRDVMKIGKPYVIEFSIPVEWIDYIDLMKLARYMLEEWIYLDLRNSDTSHQYDGRLEKEIPPESIIKIHSAIDELDG